MKLLSAKELNIIRGKVMAGQVSPEEVLSVFIHVDALEARLDEFEQDDVFGTEGWRRAFGHPDAD